VEFLDRTRRRFTAIKVAITEPRCEKTTSMIVTQRPIDAVGLDEECAAATGCRAGYRAAALPEGRVEPLQSRNV
jgi:hypothetical protein